MKSPYLFVAAVTLVAAVSSSAQGVLNFSNGAAGVDAPVRNSSAQFVATDGVIKAQIYAGPVGTVEGALVAVGSPISFSLQPGYYFGGQLAIPGVAGGSSVVIQVRTFTGATYAAAITTPGAQSGKSGLITVPLVVAGGATAPNNLVGLAGYTMTLTPVPEPSVIALAGLGLGGLILARRSKKA